MRLIAAMIASCVGMLSVPFLMLFGFLVSLVASWILSYPLMLAWNYSMQPVFHLPAITFLQAFALQLVSTLLIKGVMTNKK